MTDMLTAFSAGLLQVFVANTFLLMLLGIALGFVVGILPGLGGGAALALMLPFTYKMQAFEAFAFLLGMAAVLGTTGDITSILFGIPGEAHTAATVVDGHPMAMKGEAGRALGAALMSSLVGAVFGALALAVAIPIVRPLVLSIGYAEFLMLSLLGVTFVAALSGGAVLKGLIAGAFGFLLAMIGLDPINGVQRYTFGQLFLWDGVGLVPAVMGLFAVPEIIEMATMGTSPSSASVSRLGGVMQGVRDTFRHWGLVLRCSALGAYLGIIPGMGAIVSQWLAYAHAVQSSEDRQRFGKGAVEGVLGPGAANNSALGGILIPTIAFGVPPNAFMALLLGAFLIQGLVPGPKMLVSEREGGHLTLTFFFVWSIIVANVITVAVCFLFLKQLARITNARATLLIPIILLMTYLGAFAEKNVFADLGVMLVFGALGWVMDQTGWPKAPLILGLVLGPLVENNLFLAVSSEGAGWLGHPGVIVLTLLMIGAIAYAVLGRRAREDALLAAESDTGSGLPSAGFGLCLVAVFALALWQSRRWGWEPRLFPLLVTVLGLPLAVAQVALEVRAMRATTGVPAAAPAWGPHRASRRMARIWAWIVGYFLAIWLVGFSPAALIATVLYLRVDGRERWPVVVAVALVTWVLLEGLFVCGLHLPFPEGLLTELAEAHLGLKIPRLAGLRLC